MSILYGTKINQLLANTAPTGLLFADWLNKKGYSVRLLTSSLRHPKILIKEFSYFLMPCHQHGLRINLLV